MGVDEFNLNQFDNNKSNEFNSKGIFFEGFSLTTALRIAVTSDQQRTERSWRDEDLTTHR